MVQAYGQLDRLITRTIIGPSMDRDAFNQPVPGLSTTVTLWASRRDFDAKDQLEFGGQLGGVQVLKSRWLTRGGLGFDPWKAGDSFLDEDGLRWTVEGVAELGRRGEFLELASKVIT